MASSAFKSTSKRGNLNSTAPNSHNSRNSSSNSSSAIRKRSQSVSAISRTTKQTSDISSEFSNKRENPLFWASTSSSPNDQENNDVSYQITSFRKRAEKDREKDIRVVNKSTTTKAAGTTSAAAERGRSVTRNSGVKNGIGRSLSRVRGRSVSRGPYGTYDENDKEQELVPLINAGCNSDFKKVANNLKSANIVRNGADVREKIKSLQITSSQCQETECSEDDSCNSQFSKWEDGISTYSLSEAEEKTTRAVCEQMKGDLRGDDAAASGIYETVRSEVRRAMHDIQNDIESAIRRGNVNGVATTDIADVPPDRVNSGAVELILDIRREYGRKLEESEERARKLRADLAVEEHRGQEFSRILKETLPDPKTSNPRKSRMERKRSTERKTMSKLLTEEARAYFDECVSISTFDSSDFSASEDPLCASAEPSIPVDGFVSIRQGSSTFDLPLYVSDSFSNNKQTLGYQGQRMLSGEDSDLTANSISNALSIDQVDHRNKSTGSSQRYKFSIAQKPKEDMVPQINMTNYIKHFERGINKNAAASDYARLDYDVVESDLHGCLESVLFDRVFFKDRVESGSLHLCSGSIAVSFFPFGCVL